MNMFFKSVFALALSGVICVAAAQSARPSPGSSVKAALEKKNKSWVRDDEHGTIRNVQEATWTNSFTNHEYFLTHSSTNVDLRYANLEQRYFTLNTKLGKHSDEIRMLVVVSPVGAKQARDGLFDIMGKSTSMMITPDTFIRVDYGPGDACFTLTTPANVKAEHNSAVITYKIWFSRDNVAVELSCSGETDLLSIAKDIDRAIQLSPEK